jgi:hypothetical protein
MADVRGTSLKRIHPKGITVAKEPNTNVVATFEDKQQSHDAVRALKREGFESKKIAVSIICPDPDAIQSAEDGAGKGSLVGAGLGVLAGAAAAAGILPDAGLLESSTAAAVTIAACGTIAGTAIGAALGASGTTAHAPSVGHEAVERSVITVATDGRAAEAENILTQCGGADTQCVAR